MLSFYCTLTEIYYRYLPVCVITVIFSFSYIRHYDMLFGGSFSYVIKLSGGQLEILMCTVLYNICQELCIRSQAKREIPLK